MPVTDSASCNFKHLMSAPLTPVALRTTYSVDGFRLPRRTYWDLTDWNLESVPFLFLKRANVNYKPRTEPLDHSLLVLRYGRP